jgi:hypothetical protein
MAQEIERCLKRGEVAQKKARWLKRWKGGSVGGEMAQKKESWLIRKKGGSIGGEIAQSGQGVAQQAK